jgi:hypothetical protein
MEKTAPASSRQKETRQMSKIIPAATLFADWHKLPVHDLQDRNVQIRRAAVWQHLNIADWKQLDRMRRRLTKLSAEAMR